MVEIKIDHEFKSHSDVFWPAVRGEKMFEFRKDDRGGYRVGQIVRLRLWRGDTGYADVPPVDRRITNILRPGEFGLQAGYCILSLAPIESVHPDSATPSGDGGESATSGEIEGLVETLEQAMFNFAFALGRGPKRGEIVEADQRLTDARTALLSRIVSTPTGGGDLEALSREDRDQIDAIVAGIRNGRYDWRERVTGCRSYHIPPHDMDLILRALLSPVPGGGEQQGASSSMNGLSQVEAASGLNPSDFDPSRIFTAKWLDPQCIGSGCQSLLWRERYQDACRGRREFREAFRRVRRQRDGFERDTIRLAAFAKEVIAAGWNAHVDEEFVHRASLRHGLVSETIYDPSVHGSNDVDAEAGDPWFVFSGPLLAPAIETGGQNPEGSGAEHESAIDAVEAPSGDDDWALTIARRIAGRSIYDIAEALRHADACGHMRGHEAGAKAKPSSTTGSEAPGSPLFDRLHIESMTREWFADSPPPTLDGYLNVLRRRLNRAASL